ncbi:beta-1,3-galactosyltransferase 2-like [Dunckerocampus dactyliophorus]|uniref:beta-1,3-galactosyltransferase 2-like n=1 Tax=Dunckerocampus dactyliophorus TaxID=161453 RepID=UPI00240523DB|nr:beta-1,3-galactosyltransferase 2-like [Dunckerocampus dactyliophorus]
MRTHVFRRSVGLLVVSVVIVACVYALLARNGSVKQLPKPRPAEEHRLLSPETYTYLLNQPAACKVRKPFLVLMVPVAPHDYSAREAIRKTWGTASQDTLTLFYMGITEGGQARSTLWEESRTHSDVIQMNFLDTYKNLTIKTMMMMNWLATHCPDVFYAMKVDADIFVNVFYLVRMLRSSPRRGYITGSVISHGKPQRNAASKWALSEQMYPEDRLPTYVSGAGYVFSIDLAAEISRASRFVRLVPYEDVYVGLCLRVLGIRPVYGRTWLFKNLFEIRNLEYDRCRFAGLVLVNGFQPSQLLQAWKDFSQGYKSC